jgi:hypothetical protein
MKTQTTSRNIARPAAFLAAAFVLAMPYTNIARASVSAGVLANTATIYYNLAANASAGCYGLPPANSPVLVTGVNTTVGYRGVGFIHLLYATASPALWDWSGINTAGAASNPVASWTTATGVNMVDIGFSHSVSLQTCGVNGIAVKNNSGVAQAGSFQMLW